MEVRSSKRHRYSLYGLVLDTSFELGGIQEVRAGEGAVEGAVELIPGGTKAFVGARDESEGTTGLARHDDWFRHTHLSDGSDYLRWRGHFEFLVDGEGRRITYLASENASLEALQTYMLSQVLSFVLLRRGIEPLHAAVVVVEGGSVAFVGESGAGKSTLAASFLAAGYAMLTDDLLVLRQRENGLLGLPGMPRIKLYPEAADSVLPRAAAGIPMNQWTHKRILPLTKSQFHSSPAPLAAILVLGSEGTHSDSVAREAEQDCARDLSTSSPRIENLASRGAFLQLLENTYNPLVDDDRRLKRHFRQLASWAEGVPLATLSGPRDLCRVGELRDAVLDYLSAAH